MEYCIKLDILGSISRHNKILYLCQHTEIAELANKNVTTAVSGIYSILPRHFIVIEERETLKSRIVLSEKLEIERRLLLNTYPDGLIGLIISNRLDTPLISLTLKNRSNLARYIAKLSRSKPS